MPYKATVRVNVVIIFCEYLQSEQCVYTTSQKFLNNKNFNIFKEVSSAHQACMHLFDPKYSISRNIVNYFYYLK